MNLKEQLEILRGEPIREKAPIEQIPCIETSDPEKLCKHPVVSVNMITYNHEPYIRQAIEGVMMQQTDFEFELIIGEDASQDKTREICFEYQKKYPDKIRVLWSEENVNHLGGNGRRVMARCRGEYIALCEGDDYWIDPLKLQKQVDVMRKHPDVGFCFCGAKQYYQAANRFEDWNEDNVTYKPGVQQKRLFFIQYLLGMGPKFNYSKKSFWGFIMTASTLFRKDAYELVQKAYDIFNWQLNLGDATLWLALSSMYDGYYLEDQGSIYRIADTGVFHNDATRSKVQIDSHLVRLYFFRKVLKQEFKIYPQPIFFEIFLLVCKRLKKRIVCMKYVVKLFLLPKGLRCKIVPWYLIPHCLSILLLLSTKWTYRFAKHFIKREQWDENLVKLYESWPLHLD